MLTRRSKIIEIGKSKLLTFGFAILFNTTLAGLVCGTFAWYTYATRAGFEDPYQGTTVTDAGFLRIGLVCDYYLSDYKNFNLEVDESYVMSTFKYVYWSQTNGISAEAINYIVNANGYGTTIIEPTTSASNDAIAENGFHLYRRPAMNEGYRIDSAFYADKKSSVLLPFIFKTSASEEGTQAGSNVYLSDCFLSTSNDNKDDGEIHKAVRFHINNANTSVIVAPSYNDSGEDEVGGILDLDGDGFYDYAANQREVVYGEYEGTYSYKSTPTQQNGSIPKEEVTSFYSNHKKDVYAVDEDTFDAKKVSYYGITSLISRQFAIAVPDSRFRGLSYGEINVYIEGWDRHLTNEEEESAFNLDLSFTA